MAYHFIALVDCDSFFVSCEQALNPRLCGQPVCVVTGDNGCIVSRSQEAKKVGVKMGQPLFMAKREFPQVVYYNARHNLYLRFSERVMGCLRNLVSDVEVVSIDEAYADLTSLDAVYKTDYVSLAHRLRRKIWEEVKIPVSVGLAPSKLLAKLASDKAKNNGGVFYISSRLLESVLKNTDINDICGIGRSHSRLMGYNGIYTAWDYVNQPDRWLRKQMGILGLDIKYELLGHYIKKVNSCAELPQSVQDTSALPEFTSDPEKLKSQLYYHLHRACYRMRREGCFCTIAGIMLRTKDFMVVSDKIKLPGAVDGESEIAKSLMALLPHLYRPGTVYRSTGVFLSGLLSPKNSQPELFETHSLKNNPLSKAWDELENKFGKGIIKSGW